MLISRNMSTDLVYDLPKVGIIALTEDNMPIAAGFLRKIEGGYGMLDSYITLESIPSKIRNEALDFITMRLIDTAEDLNIYKLIAFSEHESIHNRALAHGFGNMPMHFCVKPMK